METKRDSRALPTDNVGKIQRAMEHKGRLSHEKMILHQLPWRNNNLCIFLYYFDLRSLSKGIVTSLLTIIDI